MCHILQIYIRTLISYRLLEYILNASKRDSRKKVFGFEGKSNKVTNFKYFERKVIFGIESDKTDIFIGKMSQF